jgi:hypothetical protein
MGEIAHTSAVYARGMTTARYVYWQDGEQWLRCFEEYPDYMTQGATLADLQEYLKELYGDLTSGQIPGVRRVAELPVP